MELALWFLFASGAFPMWKAWVANRGRPVRVAVGWAIAAWAAWGGWITMLALSGPSTAHTLPRYLAVSLTCCAGIAVLGARRPGAAAWNAVVAGLLAVLLLPLANRVVLQGQPLHWLQTAFMGGCLAVTFLNYLPTCMRTAALLFALGSATEMAYLVDPALEDPGPSPGWIGLGLAPWAAYLGWLWVLFARSEADKIWLDFRNRYGVFWGVRMKDQFNRAAANAGWPVHLFWAGLRLQPGTTLPDDETVRKIIDTLKAVLKRFNPVEEAPAAEPPAQD